MLSRGHGRVLLALCAALALVHHAAGLSLRPRSRRALYPEAYARTFLRDAVEKSYPHDGPLEKSAQYRVLQEYGTRSLPLRSAVELVPEISVTRLPLRDAVERRPAPEVSGGLRHATQPARTPPGHAYKPIRTSFSSVYVYRSAIPPYRANATHQELLHADQVLEQGLRRRRRSLATAGRLMRANRNLDEPTQIRSVDAPEGPRLVCYVEGGAAKRRAPMGFAAADVDAFACTHVVYQAATLEAKGYGLIARDHDYDVVKGGFRAMASLKRLNPKLKVLISVGATSAAEGDRFGKMSAYATHRETFLRTALAFLEEYEMDGVDMSWPHPGAADKDNYELLLDEMSEVLHEFGYLVSVAVPGSRFRAEDGFVPRSLGASVDFLNLRAFDFRGDDVDKAGNQAPLMRTAADKGVDMFFNVDYAVRYWLKRGFPASKLVVGVPFHGRSFNATAGSVAPGAPGHYTNAPGYLAYYELCETIQKGWKQSRDDNGGAHAVLDGRWIGWDDQQTLDKKMAYIKDMNLGGAAVWSLDLDDFQGLCGERYPLLKTVRRALRGDELVQSGNLVIKDMGHPEMIVDKGGANNHNGVVLVKKKKPEGPLVVCYMTNWAFYRQDDGKFVPEQLEGSLCTHVVYAFASLDPETLLMKEFDPWADLDNGLYSRTTSIQGPEILLSLGGWTDSTGDKYSRLVNDGSARRKFVVAAAQFLRRHRFDGLHLDWNYPVCWQSNCAKGPAADRGAFTRLVRELRDEFGRETPELRLAVALSGYQEVQDVAYDLREIGDAVDFMSVMTYDYHGHWERKTGLVAPLYGAPADDYPQYNTNYTMEHLVSRGAPRSKLLVGVPFYGQTFTLDTAHSSRHDVGAPAGGPGRAGLRTRQPGMLAYHEICDVVRKETWKVSRLSVDGFEPYAWKGDQWVGYEDVESVERKGKYIREKGFGGAVAWTVDLDDFNNICCRERFPLLRSLNRALGRLGGSPPRSDDCTRPAQPVTPTAPTLTTGVDSGASGSTAAWGTTTEHMHQQPPTEISTTEKASTIWWQKPQSEFSTMTWWTTGKPTTTSPWWVPSSTTTTTTMKPSTTTTKVTAPPATSPLPGVQRPDTTEMVKPESCQPGTYLADAHDCNAYYHCVLGEKRKQNCAAGLHWNQDRLVCDWPAEAKCHLGADKPDSIPDTTQHVTTTPMMTTHRVTSPHPTTAPQQPTTMHTTTTTMTPTTTTTAQTTTAASADDSTAGEPCQSGTYYPHQDCDKFYICVNGVLVKQKCGPGLMWNNNLRFCDWTFNVHCGGEKKKMPTHQTDASGVTAPAHQVNHYTKVPKMRCEAGSYSRHANDCGQYMMCLFGQYETFSCASGLHWNNEMHICDWPANSGCETASDVDNSVDAADVVVPVGRPTTPTYVHTTVTTTTKAPTPSTTRAPLEPLSGYYKVVCYFTNWAWYRRGAAKYLPENIDERLCTHIVYGFAVLDYERLVIKAHDSWADFDNKFYERVVAYKKKGLKVSLALGGWNDSQGDKYSRLVNDPAARARFIKHALDFLDKYGFDGLDLDWEYPKCWQVDCKKGPDSDKAAFSAWVSELREAFRPKGLLLSAAVSPNKKVIDAGYDVPTLGRDLDWVAVMTYDYHGQWDKQTGHVAPLYVHPDDEVTFFNANYTIHYWIELGVPRRKLIMGMPLYGQSFQLETAANNGLNAKAPGPGQAGEFTKSAGFLAYYEICDRVQNRGWEVVKDPLGRMGPFARKGNQWVSYDDLDMIRKKSQYVRTMDLGGAMIWALDLDDFKDTCGGGPSPLLTTIRETLRSGGTNAIDEEIAAVPTMKPTAPPVPVATAAPAAPVAVTTITSVAPTQTESQYKVVCYFTNWAWYRQGGGKYLPGDIDPELCTHIVYGFAVLDGGRLEIKPHDSWADYDNKFYEKVTALRAKGVKVLLALGGWNDSQGDKYSRLVNSAASRANFVRQALEFVTKNNFDGLDLDWEYPKCWQVDCSKGPDSDKQAFSALVKELSAVFKPKGLLLSAAVSPNYKVVDGGYEVPVLSEYLDWIAVMCYDYHGQWDKVTGHVAPMYVHDTDVDEKFNTNFTIHYWIEKGADKRKLVMGMPLYGQSFSLADNSVNGLLAPTYGGGEAGEATRARGFLSYYEICHNIKNKGWNVVHDPKGRMGPYAYLRDQWVSFDDVPMLQHKSEYIKAMGLGGGMVWALDLDDFKDNCGCEPYPLLRTINRALRDYAKPAPTCPLSKVSKGTPVTPKPYQHETSNEIGGGPCNGKQFIADESDCNKYWLCNQGMLVVQSCPAGLYWNRDRCDWPENTKCQMDVPVEVTTVAPAAAPTATAAPPLLHHPTTSTYKVVCYFTNWAWYRPGDGKYRPEDIDADLCTHINYGFAVLDSNTLTIKPHDSWADLDNDFYGKVTALRAKGIKVLLALGGWNDSQGDKYSRLVNNPTARATFVKHALEFIERYNFDGLDLDWEYPKCWQVDCNKGPASDKQAFGELLRELSEAFRPKGLLLTAAVSPSKTVIDAGYDVPALAKYLDWISVMTYDFHGHWDKQTGHVAPLYHYPGDTYDYFNSNFSLNYWMALGAPASKLIMGMPLYGQSFTLADQSKRGLNAAARGPGAAGEFTRAGGFLAYYEVCERVKKQGWIVDRDPQGRIGPFAYLGDQWVGYDDVSDIRRKSNYIKQTSLGGGMVWALDLDDFRDRCGCGKHPLLRALNHELRGVPATQTHDCT